KGGVGLIMTSYASVSADAPLMFNMAISDDSWVEDWRRLIDALHACGTKVGIQLMHVGMLYLFAGFVPKGATMKVPSPVPWVKGDIPCHVMTAEDIDRYVEDFARAARRAREAGADLIELHSCHGSLAGMFMSPILNRRRDEYGGNVENRTRFPRRIIERIRETVGPDFPIVIRINGSDDLEGGTTVEEAIQQARILESAGADGLSVSRGIEFWATTTIPSYLYPNGSMLSLVDEIKQAVKSPVIAAGKITPELAAEVIRDGRADFIALGRPLLADPILPAKLSNGRVQEVRRCIYCMNCLNQDRRAGRGSCSVNPFLNRESQYPMNPANRPKKVMVIGGGLAGMQSALLLAERGHNVSLHEKEARLGGQWNIASVVPDKSGHAAFVGYLERNLERSKVEIRLNAEVTGEKVLELKPDAVVIATGAVPAILDIPGARRPNVVQAVDVIAGKSHPKGRVVVLGGRFTAIETAILLAERGVEVSLVTRGALGLTLERMTLRKLTKRLIDLRVPLYLNTAVLEINESTVAIRFNEEVFELPADTAVLAVGMNPQNELARELDGLVPEVHTVGDCVKPRNAAAVAYQAAQVAARI
ncbi:MAG: FAD-binding protein, partial [Chloroflexi bacterium]|nr:FAD-binding protein [Chloroflexota bacterium]